MEELSGLTIKHFFDEDAKKQERVEREYYIKKYNDLIYRMQEAKRGGRTSCAYAVREYEIDADYSFMDCIAFIISKLKESGFTQISYQPPNTIIVSWINEEIEKEKIRALHGLYIESQKPSANIVIAPPIMWSNNRSRQLEHIKRNREASLKSLKTIKDRDKFIEASKNYLLNGGGARPQSPPAGL